MKKKNLLIVAHAPSGNTRRLRDALAEGARDELIENVAVQVVAPLQAGEEEVLSADAVILFTPENLGYMSGAMKDFFDRIYYPVLEVKQGLPVSIVIRAGHDGTGTCRALETILTGLKWSPYLEPLICRGSWQEPFVAACRERGMTVAAALDNGII